MTEPKGTAFSPYHLKSILYLLFVDDEYRDKFFPILKPDYFRSDKLLYTLAKAYWLMYERFGIFPNPTTFGEELFTHNGQNIDLFPSPPPPETLELLGTYLINLMEMEEPAVAYISSITLKVIKLAAIHNVLGQNKSALMDGTIDVDELAQEVLNASAINEKKDLGVNAFQNLERRTQERLALDPLSSVIPLNIPGISEHLEDRGVPRGTLSFFLAPTGTGKCLSPLTPVMLYTGKLKAAKDIATGDFLMGPDSLPRRVLSTTTGAGPMYHIIPTKGESFECNDVHILTLVATDTNEIIDISLREYLTKSKTFRHRYKLFTPERVEFPWRQYPNIDPYFLGAWFGDGTKNLSASAPSITTMDKVIIDSCKSVANTFALRVNRVEDKRGSKAARYDIVGFVGKTNLLTKELRSLVGDASCIPDAIKYGSFEVRLEFLAGIIDTDGSLMHNSYDVIQKRKQYADDIAFIARSLGLAAYVTPCQKASQNGTVGTYYRLCINGDTAQIPVRIKYKKAATRKQKKNVRRNGFTVEYLGVDKYAGFTLNGDGRFLLGDFKVTHNTTALLTITKTAVLAVKKVLYISAELSQYEIFKRFDSAMSGIPKKEIRIRASEVQAKLMSSARYQKALQNLVVIEVPMGSTTVKDIEMIIKELAKKDFIPDLLVVDYADNLAPLKYSPNAPRIEIYSIYRDLRALAQTYNLAAFTASQTNDMGTAAAEDEKQHMSVRHSNEARAKTHIADLIIGLARTADERANAEARAVLLKNRFGGNESTVVKIYPNFDLSLMWTDKKGEVYPLTPAEARATNYGAPDNPEAAIVADIFDRMTSEINEAEQESI